MFYMRVKDLHLSFIKQKDKNTVRIVKEFRSHAQ